jgi:hypothetical protein
MIAMRSKLVGVVIILAAFAGGTWNLLRPSSLLRANSAHFTEAGQTIAYDSLLEGFRNPPSEYGQVECWWWEAGHLDKEKLRWELEELKDQGIGGIFLYPRFLYDEPLRSDPPYWSEGWWDLVGFTMKESRRLGLFSWFSDWTANQFIQNRLRVERKENPALWGHRLAVHEEESKGPGPIAITLADDEQILDAGAFKKSAGGVDYSSRKDLRGSITGNKLQWSAPAAGWLVCVIVSQPYDFDYLNPMVMDRWAELLLGPYAQRFPGYLGKTLAAYGIDERHVLNGNILYSPSVVSKIRSERGYDITPFLVGLALDIGSKTDQIRCDYYRAMNSLLDENCYKPLAEHLHTYGLKYVTVAPLGGDDLLTETAQFGDVFRYLGSYDIPGAEDPEGNDDITKRVFFNTKLFSSISDLYDSGRSALCLWGAGWGMTQEEDVAWTNMNYAYGDNLFTRDGSLYTLMGGWYEWVPPDADYYQPYWKYYKPFADYVRRLSYIMSQGHHRPEVGVLYPLSTIQANLVAGRFYGPENFDAIAFDNQRIHSAFNSEAKAASDAAMDLAKRIYESGVDMDFIDQRSIVRSQVEAGRLKVSGMEFKVLVLPAVSTIPTATLKMIRDFYASGGTVVAFGRLPDASAERGRGDPEIRSLIAAIFGTSPVRGGSELVKRSNANGGKAFFVPSNSSRVSGIVASAFVPDVVASEPGVYHTHREIGNQQVYFLFNIEPKKRDLSFRFRVEGEPEIWDPFTGQAQRYYRFERVGDLTKVRLEMEPYQGVVVLFPPASSRSEVTEVLQDSLTSITKVEESAGGIKVEGYSETGGDKRARLRIGDQELVASGHAEAPAPAMQVRGPFSVKLEPTMDNRWGDFHYPASNEMIGAEADSFKYMEEGQQSGISLGWNHGQFDDSRWPAVIYSYGPYWWHIGPFEEGKEPSALFEDAKQGKLAENQHYEIAGRTLQWEPYSFSQKFGYFGDIQGNPGIGLLGVSENFLVFDQTGIPDATQYLATYIYSDSAHDSVLYFGGKPEKADYRKSPSGDVQHQVAKPKFDVPYRKQAWVNGRLVLEAPPNQVTEAHTTVHLKQGWNPVLLKIVQQSGTGMATYAVIRDSAPPPPDPYVPEVRWFSDSPPVVYDLTPHNDHRIGWYRFKAPPGLTGMRITAKARGIEAWINGEKVPVENGAIKLGSPVKQVSQVALRVEQEPGTYAGAVFPEPIAFDCQEGEMGLGDWSDYGLETYSGIVVYTKAVNLGKGQLQGKVILDLGLVKVVAEVLVNGKSAGVRLARPFSFDMTDLLKAGPNTIEVKVANTLANHMRSYPTQYIYKGQTVSGLLGPVELYFLSPVTLTRSVSENYGFFLNSHCWYGIRRHV